ncbi:elongation factor P 5-aminopentanone reductase [Sediminibacillus albus]|uniref:3-oxoacyl-[acyl-carrier protein] reductase n=1 Tax=Sediminibacillus albus TaxID=407036 RepID=A0A1G8VZ98_9BACI|nr:SDR family oxidoreductase [Sediminibacillus albus]SDJ71177.1 3-oxoacyl-[acyl-carrier protein] reductase [Sediminibacillus albus]
MPKKCLIIGASGDIGKAIAIRLADDGFQLLLHYHQNAKAIAELTSVLPDESVLAVLQGDLGNNQGIQLFLDNLDLTVDSVIFASGTSHIGLLQDTDEAAMDRMLSIQVKALWSISKHVIPAMVQNQSGHIIVVSSIWGESGASCEVIYSSVKGAQNSFIKALGKELAPSGITVNGVSPGFIDTKMNQLFTDEEKSSIIGEIPVNRAGKPVDVAHVVSFLLDERSGYIQSEIINVSGAW